jgi:hypothetical protein
LHRLYSDKELDEGALTVLADVANALETEGVLIAALGSEPFLSHQLSRNSERGLAVEPMSLPLG